MKNIVFDTSVLIDLQRGELIKDVLLLLFNFSVPDLLYEREIVETDEPYLSDLGLFDEELDDNMVSLAISYRKKSGLLTLPDCFALALAKTNQWILLTGDMELRKLAREEKVQFHGVLWLLDQLLEENIVHQYVLHNGLYLISAHPRCRIPKSEINNRLYFWRSY